MLETLNHTVAMALALVALLVLLFGPLAAVWILFSVRRSLARIADALESTAPRELPLLPERPHYNPEALERAFNRVSNSMFGR